MTGLNVLQFPSCCGEIIAMLRNLAEEIEAGTISPKRVVAIIDDDNGLQVRGFGDADIFRSIALLQCGSHQLSGMVNSGEAR